VSEEYEPTPAPPLSGTLVDSLLLDVQTATLERLLGLPGIHSPQLKLTNYNFWQRVAAKMRHSTATLLKLISDVHRGADPLQSYSLKLVSEILFDAQVAASRNGWFVDKLITTVSYRVAETKTEQRRGGGLLGWLTGR